MFDNHTIAGKSNHLSLNHLRYLSSSFSLDALLQSRLSYFPNREANAYGRAVQPIYLIDLLPMYDLRLLNDDIDRSHSHVVTGTVPNNLKQQ